MSTSMLTSAGIELTEVPPRTTPTLNVVLGSTGTCMRENFAIALAHREGRVDEAERAVAVAAWPLERHAIAEAADAAARDAALIAAVDRDELLDAILVLPLSKQILDAAQVALAFFADVADKQHVARRLKSAGLHRAHDREHQRQAARVVADARAP